MSQRRPLPKEWLPYADSRKGAPQINVRQQTDHYEALRRLARELDVSMTLLGRVILGRVLDGGTIDTETLIKEREDTDEHLR